MEAFISLEVTCSHFYKWEVSSRFVTPQVLNPTGPFERSQRAKWTEKCDEVKTRQSEIKSLGKRFVGTKLITIQLSAVQFAGLNAHRIISLTFLNFNGIPSTCPRRCDFSLRTIASLPWRSRSPSTTNAINMFSFAIYNRLVDNYVHDKKLGKSAETKNTKALAW